MLPVIRTADIRAEFIRLLAEKQFTQVNREGTMTAITGSTTIEIINASFIADEDTIFGTVNEDFVARERAWYLQKSRNVNTFPGGAPTIWRAVADKDGNINSDYGWTLFSPENGFMPDTSQNCWDSDQAGDLAEQEMNLWYSKHPEHEEVVELLGSSQYRACVAELKRNPESRRALAIYTRPSMWLDYNKNGRSDFMCTNTVQYLIRGGKLNAVVQMRSNDAVSGYKGDRHWQLYVLERMANELQVEPGNLYWNAGSLHVYARNYYLVDPVNYTKP